MTASPVYPTIKIYADLNNDGIAETDISAQVTSKIDGDGGIQSNKDVDFLAGTGSFRFDVRDDYAGNFASSNPLEGRRIDIKVVYQGIEQLIQTGTVAPNTGIDSDPESDQQWHFTATDWMSVAMGTQVKDLPLSSLVAADSAMRTLLAIAPISPGFLDFDPGTEVFPSMFDGATKKTVVYSEMDRIAKSELSFCYLQYRKGNGETLRFENRLARGSTRLLSRIPQNIADPSILIYSDGTNSGNLIYSDGTNSGNLKYYSDTPATFTAIMSADWKRGAEVINDMTVTRTPRRIDTSDVDLFKMDQRTYIGYSTKFNVGGAWNRTDGGNLIQASSIITPVATTDYTITENEDGTGTDFTADLAAWPHSFSPSVNGFVATFRSQRAGWFKIRVRGRGIYKDNPVDYNIENAESKKTFVRTVKAESLTREYSNSFNTSKAFADRVVAVNRAPNKTPKTFTFCANYSEDLLMAFLFLDVGDKVRITETKPSHTGDYYIQAIKYSISLGGEIWFTWYVKEEIKTLCSALAISGPTVSAGRRSAVDFGVLPHIANMSGYTYSAWVKRLTTSATGSISHSADQGAGQKGNFLHISHNGGGGATLYFRSYKTPTDGIWQLDPATGIVLNTWIHLVLAYDNSTDTADPILYISGTQTNMTETNTPSGTSDDDSACPLVLFNLPPDPATAYEYYYDTVRNLVMKDMRIYNRVLTAAEVAEIYASPDDYTTVPDGLVFQGFYAPTDNISDYFNDSIVADDLVLESVYGIAGLPYNEDASAADKVLSGVVP